MSPARPPSMILESKAQEEQIEEAFKLLSGIFFVEISVPDSEAWFLQHFGQVLWRGLRDRSVVSFVTTSRLNETAQFIQSWSQSLRSLSLPDLEAVQPRHSQSSAHSGSSLLRRKTQDNSVLPVLPNLEELQFTDPGLIPIFASIAPVLTSIVQLCIQSSTSLLLETSSFPPTFGSSSHSPMLLKSIETSLPSLSSLRRIRLSFCFGNLIALSRATIFPMFAHPTLEALELVFVHFRSRSLYYIQRPWFLNPLMVVPNSIMSFPSLNAHTNPSLHVPPSLLFAELMPALRYLRLTFRPGWFSEEEDHQEIGGLDIIVDELDRIWPDEQRDAQRKIRSLSAKTMMLQCLLDCLRQEPASALHRVEVMYPDLDPDGAPSGGSKTLLVASRVTPTFGVRPASSRFSSTPAFSGRKPVVAEGADNEAWQWVVHEEKSFDCWTPVDDVDWDNDLKPKYDVW
ncbi:hypothetical protein DL93DRAFT_2167834 [Clavulina sp. PMI_390]|nr:hypothetical protein DL93DRAFT_2167834 [Clavulina sp. PMI_390]